MGTVQCPFQLGGHSFEFNFIACQNLTRLIILGLDFMQKHQIGLNSSDIRKGLLIFKNKVLVEILNICETGPQHMTYSSLTLPLTTLAVLDINVDLKGVSVEHIYEVKPNSFLIDQYPTW